MVLRKKHREIAYLSIQLQHCVRESVAAMQASEHSHYIEVALPSEPVTVCGDDIRVGQVVTNLLSNAIKYSPDRQSVHLTMEVQQDKVKIIVKDDGIGIPSDKLKRIFDRFYRVDTLPKGKFPGLGLFIVSEIVRQHHGHVGVDSEEGQGTSFWFTLPIETANHVTTHN